MVMPAIHVSEYTHDTPNNYTAVSLYLIIISRKRTH